MSAYYNEIDPYAARWLRNLIAAGHIAAGDVDERSIVDVRPDDLRPYRQCHFFAGIGGWSYALRLAGWDDEREVWTGSCPCQPLSVAGHRAGHADERHLWPAFYRLIAECCPATVFGEQVASKDGREWLAAVRADLESCGYAIGAADLCAASVGAPHIRQRLWWVGRTELKCSGRDAGAGAEAQGGSAVRAIGDDARPSGATGELADADRERCGEARNTVQPEKRSFAECGATGELADATGTRRGAGRAEEAGNDGTTWLEPAGLRADGMADASSDGRQVRGVREDGLAPIAGQQGNPAERSCGSPWSDLVWLPCTDGKARPTQSGIFPLAHGATARVGRLRAYGNAIVAQTGAAFIGAFLDAEAM